MPVPEHLHINNREPDENFNLADLLYHGFFADDFDQLESILKVETIRFPDFSCNWNRYSEPVDIRYRENGSETDGCYSFSVEVSRFDNLATPVHDPIDHEDFPNYSHVEVRVMRATDPEGHIPQRGRKFNNKEKKMRYRQNIANKLSIEIPAESV